MRSSLAVRLIAGAFVWLVVALGLAGFGLGELFEREVEATYTRQLSEQLDRIAASLEWSSDRKLYLKRQPSDPLYSRPYSGRYWQVSTGDGAVLASDSLWDRQLASPPVTQAGSVNRFIVAGPHGQSLLLLERAITLPNDETPVRIGVAIDRAELRDARHAFDGALAVMLSVLGAGLMLAVVAQVMYGLWPLKRLHAALLRVQARHRTRLGGAWPAEVRTLVDQINVLIDRDAEVLERARRQASDLAHALKTPLAVLSNEAAGGESRLHKEVGVHVETMRRQVERHLARARAAGAAGSGGSIVDATAVVRELANTLLKLYREKRLEISLHGNGTFRGDSEDLSEIIGNLLENACIWARQRIDVTLREQEARLEIRVDDDGSGMSAEDRARVLSRFERLDVAVPGSGLGLAISADISSLYGGRLTLEESPSGGLSAVLDLPAGAGTPPSIKPSSLRDPAQAT